MSTLHSEMSPVVNLTRRHAVGVERTSHPVYVDLLPPCNHACPAGENIQAWLAQAQAGHWHAAWETLVADNPFPAIHGRVCYHPCEGSCNRGELDSAISIHAVERFLGDQAQAEGWTVAKAAPSGKRVLVIGAGPSGLAAAWHLARLGHEVEIRDAGPVAGGMMQFGIPAYRLPREVLAKEIAKVEQLGVKIVLDHKVEDILAEQQAGHFDAIYIAIGAQVGRHIDIPARDAARVLDAVSLLHTTASGEKPLLGRRVIVYGGSGTAMDAARTAKRLGADDAMIVYYRDSARMAAQPFEVKEALAEGIKIKWLSSIKDISGETVTVEKMVLDDKGRPQPTGEYETLQADSVVLALGQTTDIGFLRKIPGIEFQQDGTVIVGDDMQTGRAGIFAGGDVVPAQRSVTNAVGLGKKAARHIDAWLAGTVWTHPSTHRLVSFKELNLPLYADVIKAREPELPAPERADFSEIVGGLDEAAARHEAQRCLSCGNCYECDHCYAACPEAAIVKLGPDHGYDVNLDLCTGCQACFEQCPCHAIDMTPEAAAATGSAPIPSEKELTA
ncbi:NAD(P)-binding protein [Caballeronia sp. dw_19]|uniref:NAD(P)-binding protein n=1 Tax=Caballeronia sp. dw_19 TaxID=2719791 RepID=UPI001BD4C006|nr:NAD(P)-binding protein [Caballeronia sp. dw_19]